MNYEQLLSQAKIEAEKRYPYDYENTNDILTPVQNMFIKKRVDAIREAFVSGVSYSPAWVKVSDKLPLHLAFWNIEDGFKKDCTFPVRIGKSYAMGELFDQRLKNEPTPKYSICINSKHHFEDEFYTIEWLDEYAIAYLQAQQKIFSNGDIRNEADACAKNNIAAGKSSYHVGVDSYISGYAMGVNENDAIAFAEWILSFEYEKTDCGKWLDLLSEDDGYLTTSELYSVYLKNKRK